MTELILEYNGKEYKCSADVKISADGSEFVIPEDAEIKIKEVKNEKNSAG